MNCPPLTWAREVMENTEDTNNNRIDQFKADVSDMNLKTGSASRESLFQVLGFLLMVGGVVGALVAYISSGNLDDARDIQSMIVLAVALGALTVFGAAIFLRYSLARFLRMWLLRQLFEGQSNTDRIVDAVSGRS